MLVFGKFAVAIYKALIDDLFDFNEDVSVRHSTLGTFRSDYDYEYEYEFFNVYPVRMPDCVRLSRQLVLSSKSRRRLDANYEIFNKSRPSTTSSLQVQRRAKRLVFQDADTL